MHLIRPHPTSAQTKKWPVIVALTTGCLLLLTAVASYPVALNWGRWTTEWAGQSVAAYAKKHPNVEDVTVSVQSQEQRGNGGPRYDAGMYTATVRLHFSEETNGETADQLVGDVSAYAQSLHTWNEWLITN